MKLLVMSDLHTEFSTFQPPETDADLVILAGDIGVAEMGMRWARRAFAGKAILYVPGNHEFYHQDRVEMLAYLRGTATASNIVFLDNDQLIWNGVRFLGATLWTDFALLGDSEAQRRKSMHHGQQRLADFRLIRDREQPLGQFNPMHSAVLFNASLAWLEARLGEPFGGKTVVVTHHLPSMLSVIDKYKTDALSPCFASSLDHLFGKMDMWIHGHTHASLDYVANGTRVVCNPRGYVTVRGTENASFDPRKVVEI